MILDDRADPSQVDAYGLGAFAFVLLTSFNFDVEDPPPCLSSGPAGAAAITLPSDGGHIPTDRRPLYMREEADIESALERFATFKVDARLTAVVVGLLKRLPEERLSLQDALT